MSIIYYNALVSIDKKANYYLFKGHHNQTISSNVGSRIAKCVGFKRETGIFLFHSLLLILFPTQFLFVLAVKKLADSSKF